MRKLVIVLGLVVGCGSKSEPVKKSYTLHATAGETTGGVPVSITVPSSWSEELDKTGSPRFKVPGAEGFMDFVSLVLFPCASDVTEPAACIDKIQGYQYSAEDMAKAKVEELGAGRRMVTLDHKLAKNDKRQVHARLFAHHAASKSVVMCVIFLSGDAGDKLGEARKACDSLAF